jgi:hypothetical protein
MASFPGDLRRIQSALCGAAEAFQDGQIVLATRQRTRSFHSGAGSVVRGGRSSSTAPHCLNSSLSQNKLWAIAENSDSGDSSGILGGLHNGALDDDVGSHIFPEVGCGGQKKQGFVARSTLADAEQLSEDRGRV